MKPYTAALCAVFLWQFRHTRVHSNHRSAGQFMALNLDEALVHAAQNNGIEMDSWPRDAITPEAVGLEEAQDDPGRLVWRVVPQVLQVDQLATAFPDWTVHHFHSVDSTNTFLMNRVAVAAECLCVAELQVGGRGRRGRAWLSPYGRNLAMSLGHGTRRSLHELGGLSLVSGIALAEALLDLPVPGVALKWPNDVTVGGKKLCGILVELARRESSTGAIRNEVVVGTGVNIALSAADREQIDQPVVDLREVGVTATRTELVIYLMGRVSAALQEFEANGFAPFMQKFNQLHALHEQMCVVIQGEQRIEGRVTGIGDAGQLLMHTADGVQEFHGGEVSLRPA